MAKKRCMVFETLGKVNDLKIQERKANDGLMRLTGVFGVAGIKNENNRIYDKKNYADMVESLQRVIATEGCPGELEHPNSMNIDLNNVSHKIESIQMNEDGTITGTIALLNTTKGKEAQAIVEGGLPLYISSRGAGSVTTEGRVQLTTIKTYDLVGTPGFSQAKLQLSESQTLECLNESLEDGNIAYAIITEDDTDAEEPKDDTKDNDDASSEDKKDDTISDNKDTDVTSDDKDNTEDNITMTELKKSIDALAEKVENLQADLHIAKESLAPNYNAVEQWIKEEFAPSFKEEISDEVSESLTKSICDGVQKWITEEYSPEIEKWVTEEYAPEVEKWITEEYSETIQNWINEEYSPIVEKWINEEYSNSLQNWISEEYGSELEKKVNENVSKYLGECNQNRLENIDSLLESLEDNKNTALDNIVKEEAERSKYKGVYVVEHMPAEYKPSWEMIDESHQAEIIRTSRMYDFTKSGVLESFWASVDFGKKDEQIVETKDVQSQYHNSIFEQMMRLRRH